MWKLPTILLVLAVTVVNAWMNWRLWRERSEPAAVVPGAVDLEVNRGGKAHAIGQGAIFRPRRTLVVARPPWSDLESDDYHEYAANLRRIGCPEKTVRDILVADINDTFAAQRRAIQDRSGDAFWLTRDRLEELERQRVRREWELRLQKWNLLRELFQYPVDLQQLRSMRSDRMKIEWLLMGFLEREQVLRAMGTVEYYTQQLRAIEAVTEGILLASDYDRARQIRDQMEASLTVQLSAANLEELLLRVVVSDLDDELPTSKHGFVVSGAELRNLFKIRLAALEVFSEIVAEHGFDDLKPEKVGEDVIETAVANYLGAERFADYLRAKDERYHGIYTFATENGLLKKDAIAVFEARVRAEDDLKRIHDDESLSPEENVLLQAAVKARVEAAVRAGFGPVIAKEYLGDGPSSWIEELITTPEEKEAAQ